MRLLLALALVVLFSWLYRAWMSNSIFNGAPCEVASASETVVSLLLFPLSLYSILTSALVRLVLSVPALVFSALHHTVVLLVAAPLCMLTLSLSLLLTCLHVALYLMHIALVGAVAIWTLSDKVKHQRKSRLSVFTPVKQS